MQIEIDNDTMVLLTFLAKHNKKTVEETIVSILTPAVTRAFVKSQPQGSIEIATFKLS